MAADGVGMGPRGRVAWLEVRIEWTHYARRTMGVTLCPLTIAPDVPLHVPRRTKPSYPPPLRGLWVCVWPVGP